MGLDTISEATFLITELRYTLGQLHVQVLDLDAETRKSVACGDRSIEQILADMLDSETRWQQRYAEITGSALSTHDESASDIPLPVNSDDEMASAESAFEHKRADTIAMLEAVGEPWPPQLLDAVKEHVGEDRRVTTTIAECRKTYFAQDQRPDLNQPLTAPH